MFKFEGILSDVMGKAFSVKKNILNLLESTLE